MNDLFDRCIDVYVYDEAGKEIARIITPEYGPKPEIKVEGCIISNTYQISGKVTITNLERSINVDDSKYLRVDMYYKGSQILQATHKSIWYSVQFADQSKQPPNRQVCFNCLVAGTTPDIMSTPVTISKQDANKKPIEDTLTNVLKLVITEYNKALKDAVTLIMYDKLKLNAAPVFRMSPTVAAIARNSKVALQWNDVALSSILDSLTLTTLEAEPTGENAKKKTTFCAYSYYIEENNLVVSLNPSNLRTVVTSPDTIKLDYVQSAYRYGNIIHIKSLFDPRIHQDVTIVMSASNISGKRVAGNLVPIASKTALLSGQGGIDGTALFDIKFRPVGGINFVFSTTSENYMTFQGCL